MTETTAGAAGPRVEVHNVPGRSGVPVRPAARSATVAVVAALAVPAGPPRAVPLPAGPAGAWLAGDLHVHTTYSHDSYGGPGDEDTGPDEPWTLGNTVTEQSTVAASRGLDYLAITDHDDVRSQSDPGYGTAGVIAVPGYENSLSGHAQMLGATAVADDDADGDGTVESWEVERLARVLRAVGGVFQVNHPALGSTAFPHDADWGYGYDVEPDTVEVWNISRLWQPPMPSASSNDAAVRYWEGWLDRGARVGATGGSDNHWKSTLAVQGPGQPTTWVFATDRTAGAVLDALRAGRTFVSHQPPAFGGPLLLLEADADGDGAFESMVGDTVPPSAAFRVRVVRAPGSILRVVVDGGEVVAEQPVVGADATVPVGVPAGASWVRAEIVEPDGAEVRAATCDGAVGSDTTYCRDQLAVLAMTSAVYVRPVPHGVLR